MNELSKKLGELSHGLTLLTADYIHISRVCILLLKILLEERKLSGVYISVDRPTTYIDNLLKARKIPTEHLKYVEMISNLAEYDVLESGSDVLKKGNEKFKPEYVVFKSGSEEIEFSDKSFALIDNIMTMLLYSPINRTKAFVKEFLTKLDGWEIITLIIVDDRLFPSLFDYLTEYSKKTIDCRKLMIECGLKK